MGVINFKSQKVRYGLLTAAVFWFVLTVSSYGILVSATYDYNSTCIYFSGISFINVTIKIHYKSYTSGSVVTDRNDVTVEGRITKFRSETLICPRIFNFARIQHFVEH